MARQMSSSRHRRLRLAGVVITSHESKVGSHASALLTISNHVTANVLENESVIHRIRWMELTEIISTRRPSSPWTYLIPAIA